MKPMAHEIGRSATSLSLIETWLRMVTAGLNGDVDYTPASFQERTRPVCTRTSAMTVTRSTRPDSSDRNLWDTVEGSISRVRRTPEPLKAQPLRGRVTWPTQRGQRKNLSISQSDCT